MKDGDEGGLVFADGDGLGEVVGEVVVEGVSGGVGGDGAVAATSYWIMGAGAAAMPPMTPLCVGALRLRERKPSTLLSMGSGCELPPEPAPIPTPVPEPHARHSVRLRPVACTLGSASPLSWVCGVSWASWAMGISGRRE